MEKDGGWLADGEYRNFVKSLCLSDPRLRQRDPKAVVQRIPYSDHGVRVVALQVQQGDTVIKTAEFDDPASLRDHFNTPTPKRGERNIFILEGLGPGFTGVLGHHFSLHPSLFVEHERVVIHNMTWRGESDGNPLPSVVQSRRHLEMRYYEPVTFDTEPSSFRWVCAATGRHIGVSRDLRWDNSPDDIDHYLDVGVVRRKCGVWSRRTEGGGWDCLVLCDPPIRSVRTGEGYKTEFPVKTRPYQGGYLDFVPEEQQIRVRLDGPRAGPPRTSLCDDLVFYLETHSRLVDIAGPESVAVFVKKLVASHYLKQAEHLRSTLSAVQRGLTRKQDLARMPMKKVEALWSDMQGWERRTGEYLEDLESIMLQLGIPFGQPGSLPLPLPISTRVAMNPSMSPDLAWQDCTADYQFLYLRFRELRHRTEALNAAVTGLAGITGNRQAYKEQQRSIRETKSTKAVTLLGLVFIPMAYMSSVFSMTEPYGPGGSEFWQYFATSIPLILLVLLGYYILDFGYNDNGTAWSLDSFNESVRERINRFKKVDTETKSFG